MKINLNNDQLNNLIEQDILDCDQIKDIVRDILNDNIIIPKENEVRVSDNVISKITESEPVNDSYNNKEYLDKPEVEPEDNNDQLNKQIEQDIVRELLDKDILIHNNNNEVRLSDDYISKITEPEVEPEDNNDTLGGESENNSVEKKCNNHKYLITDEELQGIYDLCKKGHSIKYASECYDYPNEVIRSKIKRVFPDFLTMYRSTTLREKKKVDNDEGNIDEDFKKRVKSLPTVREQYPKVEENELESLGLTYSDLRRMYEDYTNVFTQTKTKNYTHKKSFEQISEIEGLDINVVQRLMMFYHERYEPELKKRGVI